MDACNGRTEAPTLDDLEDEADEAGVDYFEYLEDWAQRSAARRMNTA